MKKRFGILALLVLVLFFSSCTLDGLLKALSSTKTNVFGVNTSEEKAAEAATSIFGGVSSNGTVQEGILPVESITASVEQMFPKNAETGVAEFNEDLYVDPETNELSFQKIYDNLLGPFKMDEAGFETLAATVGTLTSAEAREAFSEEMKKPADFGDSLPISKEDLAAIKTDFMGFISDSSNMEEGSAPPDEVISLMESLVDSIITDEGEFTQGSLVLLSAGATIFSNVIDVITETGASIDEMTKEATDAVLEECVDDALNFVSISLAVIGVESSFVASITDLMGITGNSAK